MRPLIALFLGLLTFPAWAQEYQISTSQSIAHTSTMVIIGTPVGAQTYALRLVCTQACFVNVAKTPIATAATGTFLPANTPFQIRTTPGVRVAVTASSTLGTLYVTELTK
jgi:hypothetical protein